MQLDMNVAREILTDKVSDKSTYPDEYLGSQLEIMSYETTQDALDVMAREVIVNELAKRGTLAQHYSERKL